MYKYVRIQNQHTKKRKLLDPNIYYMNKINNAHTKKIIFWYYIYGKESEAYMYIYIFFAILFVCTLRLWMNE